jgi:hypothetical protein
MTEQSVNIAVEEVTILSPEVTPEVKPKETVRQRILKNLSSSYPIKPKELALVVGAPVSQIYVILGKLLKSSEVKRTPQGYFLLTGVNKKVELTPQKDLGAQLKELKNELSWHAVELGRVQRHLDEMTESRDELQAVYDKLKTEHQVLRAHSFSVISYLESKVFGQHGNT